MTAQAGSKCKQAQRETAHRQADQAGLALACRASGGGTNPARVSDTSGMPCPRDGMRRYRDLTGCTGELHISLPAIGRIETKRALHTYNRHRHCLHFIWQSSQRLTYAGRQVPAFGPNTRCATPMRATRSLHSWYRPMTKLSRTLPRDAPAAAPSRAPSPLPSCRSPSVPTWS